jgi:hypothetical protein
VRDKASSKCGVVIRARCLPSSCEVLPIDGSAIDTACDRRVMAASNSHHSGPVSYKFEGGGAEGYVPSHLIPVDSRMRNPSKTQLVLNVKSAKKRRRTKRKLKGRGKSPR